MLAKCKKCGYSHIIYFSVLIKTTAAQNEVALSDHRVRRLYFLALIFAATIYMYVCRYYIHMLYLMGYIANKHLLIQLR